jgi:4-carboxymuconolactone decarboxylase
MKTPQYEAGLKVRKEVLGAEYVDKSLAAADSFNAEFQRVVTEYCWGGVWTRPGLTKRDRSLLNLAMLSCLNRPHEFQIHVRGALTNGVTLEEIRETLLQVAIYAGVPAGVEAFRLAREVFKEKGIVPPK